MRPLDLSWAEADDLPEEVLERFVGVLHSWKGTRYMAGVCGKQQGVDCARWCAAVLSEMEGREVDLQAVPQDSAFHCPKTSWSAVRSFMGAFWPVDSIRDKLVKPGQMIIVGPSNGGPCHAMLAGPRKGLVWHSTRSRGVQETAYLLAPSEQIKVILSIRDRERRWLR